MLHLLDLRTIAMVYVVVRIGLAVVLAYLWSVQRNYAPARDWAAGAALTAAGLSLMSLRLLVSPLISELLANLLLLPGWMIFDAGIIKASGRKPPYRIGLALCALPLVTLVSLHFRLPIAPQQILLHHSVLILFDLAAIRACLGNHSPTRQQTFRAIALLLMVSVAALSLKVVEEVFGLLGPVTAAGPKIMYLVCSLTLFPMMTMLLALLTAQKLQEELNDQARQDMLTGAFNRRAFAEFIERAWMQALRHERPLSLFSLDIDNFKSFNDRHGHQTGDQALVLVSSIAHATMRGSDIWCRHGGEEFVALLPDTGLAEARAGAERIRQAVAQARLQTPQGPLALSVSIGVAQRSADHRHWNDLLAASDAALYRAKAAGKNCVMSDDDAAELVFQQ